MGDLCFYTGKTYEHSTMQRRVVYQVIDKKPSAELLYAAHLYRFRTVFDFENPLGAPLDFIGFTGSREMKRLSLIDLGVIRLLFDEFIKSWANQCGAPDLNLPPTRGDK